MPIHPFKLEQRVSESDAIYEGLYVFDPGALGPAVRDRQARAVLGEGAGEGRHPGGRSEGASADLAGLRAVSNLNTPTPGVVCRNATVPAANKNRPSSQPTRDIAGRIHERGGTTPAASLTGSLMTILRRAVRMRPPAASRPSARAMTSRVVPRCEAISCWVICSVPSADAWSSRKLHSRCSTLVRMDLFELAHQPEDQCRERLHRHVADGRFRIEQRSEHGAGNHRDACRRPGLDPGGIEQVVEDAVQGEHAGLVSVDQVEGRFLAVGRQREHPQLPADHDVRARDALALG